MTKTGNCKANKDQTLLLPNIPWIPLKPQGMDCQRVSPLFAWAMPTRGFIDSVSD